MLLVGVYSKEIRRGFKKSALCGILSWKLSIGNKDLGLLSINVLMNKQEEVMEN